MGSRLRRVALDLAVAAGAACLLWIGLREEIAGGVHLVGAERVLHGEVPYRDFWTLYAPGSYYLLAGLFAVFGTRILVSALAGVALGAGASAVVHRVAHDVGARVPEGLLVAALFAAALWGTGFHRALGSYPPAILFYALALLGVAHAMEDPSRKALVAAGAALGAAALFKHDVGAYAALACTSGLAVAGFERRNLLGALGRIGLVAGAALCVFAPPMLWLVAQGAGPDLWNDLVVFPATRFAATRPEAYPPLLPPTRLFDLSRAKRELLFDAARWATFAFPVASALLGAFVLARPAGLPPAERAVRRARAARFGVGFLLHWRAAHVQINTHVVSLSLHASLLGAAALGTLPPRSRARRLAFVFAVLWLGAWLVEPVLGPWLRRDPPDTPIPLARAQGFVARPEDAARYAQLQEIVDRLVPEDGTIFVGERRHDAIIVSDARLYFLLDRRPATRYHELHPGVADTDVVQREIVADLERQRTPLVILRDTFGDAPLDAFRERLQRALPDAGTGAQRLDRYLASHYTKVAELGRLSVLRRRPDTGAETRPGASPAR